MLYSRGNSVCNMYLFTVWYVYNMKNLELKVVYEDYEFDSRKEML